MLTAFLLRIYEGVFRWIRQNLNKSDNYDGGGCYVTIPAFTRPNQIHPHPSYYFLANSSPSSSLFSSLLVVVGRWIVFKLQQNPEEFSSSVGFTFQQPASTPSSLSFSPFGLGWRWVGDTENGSGRFRRTYVRRR